MEWSDLQIYDSEAQLSWRPCQYNDNNFDHGGAIRTGDTADKRTAASCKLHVNHVKAVFHPHKNQKIRGRLFKLLSFSMYFMKWLFKVWIKKHLWKHSSSVRLFQNMWENIWLQKPSLSASNHLGFNHKHTSCLSRILALKPRDFGNKLSSSVPRYKYQTVTYVPTVVFL